MGMSRVFLKELGFKRSGIDHSVFYWRSGDEHTIVAIATDDMAVTSKQAAITGQSTGFLVFKLKGSENLTILINQRAYIESMVEKFGLTGAKRVSTPMDPNTHFSIQQRLSSLMQPTHMENVPYSEVIGSVFWPTVVLRPNIAFAVRTLSQFIQNLGQAH